MINCRKNVKKEMFSDEEILGLTGTELKDLREEIFPGK